MNLCQEYLTWLKDVDSTREVELCDVICRIYTQLELFEKSALVSQFFKKSIFIRGVEEVVGECANTDATFKIGAQRSKGFIGIGETNRNYLFVDPNDNYSLWVVLPSNKAIFRLSPNITQALKSWAYYIGT